MIEPSEQKLEATASAEESRAGSEAQEAESAHGAPLRLVIPVKYGIKSIKQIGSIRFTNRRPPDYWAERGYDWYAGH